MNIQTPKARSIQERAILNEQLLKTSLIYASILKQQTKFTCTLAHAGVGPDGGPVRARDALVQVHVLAVQVVVIINNHDLQERL